MSVPVKYKTQEEWRGIRRNGIGGSDAAAVLGFSPWRTPVDVWLEKTGQAATAEKNSLAVELGTELEDFVAKKFTAHTGLSVRRYGATLLDGVCLGNIDRLVIPQGRKSASTRGKITTNAFLECKTHSGDCWEEVPLHYQAQVQHYMGLNAGFSHAYIACLFFLPFGGKEFSIHYVERDDATISSMKEYLREWWQKHVVYGEPPEPTCEDDCRKIWKYSRLDSTVVASDEIHALARELVILRAQRKAIEERESEAKMKIANFMQDNDSLISDAGEKILTFRSGKDREVCDWSALCADLKGHVPSEVYEKYRMARTETKSGSRPILLNSKFRKEIENEF